MRCIGARAVSASAADANKEEDEAEDAALGPEWTDTPAKCPKPGETPPEPAVETPNAPRTRRGWPKGKPRKPVTAHV